MNDVLKSTVNSLTRTTMDYKLTTFMNDVFPNDAEFYEDFVNSVVERFENTAYAYKKNGKVEYKDLRIAILRELVDRCNNVLKNTDFAMVHPAITKIKFYNAKGELLTNYLAESTYVNVQTIEVPTVATIEALQALADYTGFSAYKTIKKPGVYIYVAEGLNGTFVKMM